MTPSREQFERARFWLEQAQERANDGAYLRDGQDYQRRQIGEMVIKHMMSAVDALNGWDEVETIEAEPAPANVVPIRGDAA